MSSSLFVRSLFLSLPLVLAACGGSVTGATEGGGGDGGAGGAGGEPPASTSSSTGGEGGAAMTGTFTETQPDVTGECALLAPITLTDPGFADPDDDGKWTPGETASVFVTMNNISNADIQYPGITWSSDNPLVSAAYPYNAFYVIFAGTSMSIDVGFTADASIPKGTQVTLTGTLTAIDGALCAGLPTVTLEVTIE